MWWVVGLLAAGACTRPRTDRHEPLPVDTAPTLTMISPDRGTFVEGATVAVLGRVRDDGPVRVTVNGADAAIAADGSFRATLVAPPGLAIIETHAIDDTGHDVRDVRSVLAGSSASSDGSSRAPIGVRLGRGGLRALGKALGASAAAIDFTATAQALNPVYDRGGCLGARADIAKMSVGKIEVALTPRPGAIEIDVVVADVVVALDVHYKVACIGGTTKMTVRTSARVRGDLRAALADRRIQTSLPAAIVVLDDFRVDIGAIPRPIEDLVRGTIRAGVETTVKKAIESKVPQLADAKLAELLAAPPTPSLLGHDLKIDVVPRRLELSATGVFVAADTALVISGGEGGRYVSTPAALAGGATEQDLGVWIAADTINQLLGGLWAARAFERTVPITAVGPLAMLLDDKVRTIEVAMSLPPTVSTAAVLELAIGDLIVTTRDADGGEVQRFAVSLRSGVAVRRGELALTTTEPAVYAQQLGQAAPIARPLDSTAVEGIVRGAWSLVVGSLDDALARVPIPGSGDALEIRALTARDGWIVLDVAARSQ